FLVHHYSMLAQPSTNSDLCYENPQVLITGTRVGESYVAVAVSSGSSVSIRSNYQHIDSQNGYLPYECNAQADCRNFGFGPDYGHHYGF
ncbi:hypothetical protein PFISCL1PPCAC_9618, partial [Pristionchus fissidentatus]